MKIDFEFIGGKLDGARGTFDMDGDTDDRYVGLPLDGHNYTLDLEDGIARHTPEFDEGVEAIKFDK